MREGVKVEIEKSLSVALANLVREEEPEKAGAVVRRWPEEAEALERSQCFLGRWP